MDLFPRLVSPQLFLLLFHNINKHQYQITSVNQHPRNVNKSALPFAALRGHPKNLGRPLLGPSTTQRAPQQPNLHYPRILYPRLGTSCLFYGYFQFYFRFNLSIHILSLSTATFSHPSSINIYLYISCSSLFWPLRIISHRARQPRLTRYSPPVYGSPRFSHPLNSVIRHPANPVGLCLPRLDWVLIALPRLAAFSLVLLPSSAHCTSRLLGNLGKSKPAQAHALEALATWTTRPDPTTRDRWPGPSSPCFDLGPQAHSTDIRRPSTPSGATEPAQRLYKQASAIHRVTPLGIRPYRSRERHPPPHMLMPMPTPTRTLFFV